MTWRFVCNHSDLIASATPIGAGATFQDSGGSNQWCDYAFGARNHWPRSSSWSKLVRHLLRTCI